MGLWLWNTHLDNDNGCYNPHTKLLRNRRLAKSKWIRLQKVLKSSQTGEILHSFLTIPSICLRVGVKPCLPPLVFSPAPIYSTVTYQAIFFSSYKERPKSFWNIWRRSCEKRVDIFNSSNSGLKASVVKNKGKKSALIKYSSWALFRSNFKKVYFLSFGSNSVLAAVMSFFSLNLCNHKHFSEILLMIHVTHWAGGAELMA